MGRTLVRRSDHDRNKSLGWLAVAWIEYFVVHGPGAITGEPVRHGDEFTGFIVDCYAVGQARRNNHLLYDSVFLSRAKGCDKSGLASRLALFEALGPCRFAGWAKGGEVYEDPWGLGFSHVYEPGEPMGAHPNAPMVRVMATEEGQTGNTYDTIHYNLTDEDAPLSQVPGVDAGLGGIKLPGRGEIMPSTSGSASKDGGKETFVVFDETHLYNTRELRQMYDTVTRNLRKRKGTDGTWYIETTTMFAAGEDSIAEATYKLAEALNEGKARRERQLYDHRWGECKNLADEKALFAALVEAYGDAGEWQDFDSLVDEFYDPRKNPEDSRRYFLNTRAAAGQAWVRPHDWEACARTDKQLVHGDMVTLGFDGSIRDDATALVACRLSDGHMSVLGLWEKPEGPAGDGWSVDTADVDRQVAAAFTNYNVVGMFADPAHWQDYLTNWTAEYGDQVKVRATRDRPLSWWTNKHVAMVNATSRLYEAIRSESVTYNPEQDLALTRHVLNAQRRILGRSGVGIAKEYGGSPRKIDAAMAAILAYECRAAAIADGVDAEPEEMFGATF